MIEMRGVTYSYPGAARPALRSVDLVVDDGSFVVVAGAPGSGKTTLGLAMCGAVPHFHGGTFAGTVAVSGSDTRTHAPRDLAGRVGYVHQVPEAQAVAELVADEISFGLENTGVEPSGIRRRIEESLELMGITHLRGRRIGTLSGGERQRVQVAAALALQPEVLVLDEPTSQLDPAAAEDVFAALQRLNADLGVTLLVIEHRLERVAQHASRLVVLDDGRVADDGTPPEVLRRGAVSTPLAQLARGLGWDPVPLTVSAGRARARALTVRPQARPAEMAGETLVRVRGVSVALGGREVLRGVDLEAGRGEVVAICGRNGSGKTTLLRAILGLARAHSGAAQIAGVARPADLPDVAAYVPQDAGQILFHRTVAEEVAATRRGSDVSKTLEEHGLVDLAAADPRDLSAGLRLRVALAAATAGAPDVICLDEPTRGADPVTKAAVASMVRAWAARGAVVLVVTHDLELIAECATRVVILADGAVIEDGPARVVLGSSPLFSSQMNKVFGSREIATVSEALAAVVA